MNKNSVDQFPPVTVAMATYNGERYLREQLDSILLQTLPPAEIIVCDDASTDGTANILEEYQRKGLLKYFVNGRTSGYIANFKKAVSLCKSDHYIALSDQDDIWLPEKIRSGMNLLMDIDEGGKPAMVYSDLIFVDEEKKIINESFRNELGQDTYEHCLETLLFGGFVNGCTMLMNPLMASYFSTIPESRFATHDTWMSLIAYTFGKVGIIPSSQILYRRHQKNTTDLIDFTKPNRFKRLIDEVSGAFGGNKLFEKELSLVKLFYNRFKSELNEEQLQLMRKFLNLEGKGYIHKKIALRSFFLGKWKRNRPVSR